jgi:hypothetical protein
MKKSIALLLLITIAFSSCNQQEKTNKQIFDMLKNINQLTFEEFSKNFISIEETEALTGKTFFQYEKTSIDTALKEIFESFKAYGDEYEIKWENIVYVDFKYHEYKNEKASGYEDGILTFKYEDVFYELSDITTVKTKSNYKIVEIGEIYKKD